MQRLRASPVTAAILVINLGWFLWAEAQGSTEQTSTLLRFGAVEPVHVWMGEYWRLASHVFLHIGWFHLLWNGYAGFGICAGVERALGGRRFLLVYAASGLVGGAATTLTLYPTSAGASGAMFGMLGALLALRRRQLGTFQRFFADPAIRSTLLNAGIWLVIGTQLHFNNRAHGGGLVAGALLTWALTSPRRAVLLPLFGAAVGALLLASMRPGWNPSREEREVLGGFGARYQFGLDSFHTDVARGGRFLRRACDAGDALACANLDLAALEDPSRAAEAIAPLTRGCDAGTVLSCLALGAAYDEGRGVAKDPGRATDAYRRASRAGAKGAEAVKAACARGSAAACKAVSSP